jgi:acetate---CoA ligase (ADP-forming)
MATTTEALGLEVPEFSEHLQKKLEAFLPAHASSRNPVDLTFHTDMELMTKTLPEMLLESGEIDGLLVHGIMDTGFADLLYPIFKDALNVSLTDFKTYLKADLTQLTGMPQQYKTPILVSSFMGEEDHCLRTFRDAGIPTFDSPEKAAHAMAALFEFSKIQQRLPDIPMAMVPFPVPEKAVEIMKFATSDFMDEYTAKEILRAYKISTPREFRVESSQEAVIAAENIGYPIVVKGCFPGILHKTEHNLVHLDCRNKQDVKKACKAISDQAKHSSFIISQMINSKREFMAGMVRFELFPPCILFGVGGIFAETINDFGVRFAPLGKNEALRLITSIKSHKLLSELRSKPFVDLNAVVDILIRLSHIAFNFPQIKEIDLNPILIDGNQPVIADAVFVLETLHSDITIQDQQ